MAWLKIDDQFPDHPKIVQAGPLASWLHVCGMAYCARYLTDGFIPGGQVRKLADVDDSGGLAEKLVASGLWDKVDGGFQVHDYLDYNPSRDVVRARRKEAQERMRNLRARRAPDVRANAERTPKTVRPLPSPSPSPIPSPTPGPVVVEGKTPTPPTTLSPGKQHKLSPEIKQKLTDTLKRPLVPSDIWHWSGLVEMYGQEIPEYAVNEAFVCGKQHWAYIDTVAEAEHGRQSDDASIRDPP